MEVGRREFLAITGGGMAFAGRRRTTPLHSEPGNRGDAPIRAIAFDAFPIFNPRGAFEQIDAWYPEPAGALRRAWFSKIFEYTWLRTCAGEYKQFDGVMGDALRHAGAAIGLTLAPDAIESVLDLFVRLPVWADVGDSLEWLRRRGVRLAFLSNMSERMLRANMRFNGIESLFDGVYSTDLAQAFKPAKRAYQLGVDGLGLDKSQIAFAAFAGWDAAGASWFGYPTVWVNRLGSPAEELGVEGIRVGHDTGVLRELL